MRTVDDKLICQGPIPNPDWYGSKQSFHNAAAKACDALTVEDVKTIMQQWTGEKS
jgi:hypothetical protein